ncbi:ACP S-malonyltransferase [Streptomyces sp. NPDC021622]|uniref:ACP S-malonyltransferase n=1 Tax=Streptomyces sp. NPDC021622 TaxID=3155013 RepID=UPI003405E3DF
MTGESSRTALTGCLGMFPGQGSQRPGMAQYLLDEYPVARELFDRADDVLGIPLSHICTDGDRSQLAATEVAQPAITATSLAVWQILRDAGYQPGAVAGHSLGEYPALVAAGVLSYESALVLVQLRGQLMAQAAAQVPGAMAAVMGIPADGVSAACQAASVVGVVEVANWNEPLQTVMSGETEAVDEAGRVALAAGAERVVRLDVSAPFHCSLMNGVQEEFTAELALHDFADPRLPLISSVTGDYVHGGEQARELLALQITRPVRWVEVLRRAAEHPVTAFTEIGPGRVLSGLARRTLTEASTRSTGDPRRLTALHSALQPA